MYLEYYREYLMTRIGLILKPEEAEIIEQMKTICEYFLSQSKPKQFNPIAPNNEIVRLEKELESVCVGLEESGVKTENITVFEFYSRIEYFEKKYEKIKQHGSNKQI